MGAGAVGSAAAETGSQAVPPQECGRCRRRAADTDAQCTAASKAPRPCRVSWLAAHTQAGSAMGSMPTKICSVMHRASAQTMLQMMLSRQRRSVSGPQQASPCPYGHRTHALQSAAWQWLWHASAGHVSAMLQAGDKTHGQGREDQEGDDWQSMAYCICRLTAGMPRPEVPE